MGEQAAEGTWLAERFEEHRGHLWAVAYRMLGSLPEADDAVQDAWVRFSAAGVGGVENLGGWLTTIVARICLNMLRARAARPEELVGVHVPDPVISREDAPDPEHEALLADSVGLALLVVLDTLAPAERLAFVLHDIFRCSLRGDRPDGGPLCDRGPPAGQPGPPPGAGSRGFRPDADRAAQRAVVDAFFAAARSGDFGKLLALLDPDVVLRADGGAGRPAASAVVRGAAAVAKSALIGAMPGAEVCPLLVNGAAGVVIIVRGRPVSLMGFTVTGGRITAIDGITDPERLSQLNLATHGGQRKPRKSLGAAKVWAEILSGSR